jgi:rubrerythrin
MPIKVSKEEWELFQKWKEEQTKKKKEEETKEETFEIEDDVFDEILDEIEDKEEKEEYICPVCSYKDTKPFERCPNCKTKLKWD